MTEEDQPLDDELKELAALAVRNAFWRKFSAVCDAYLFASAGTIECVDQEQAMGDLTSIYGRADGPADDGPNIYTTTANGRTNGWDKLAEALLYDEATTVHIDSVKVFERVNGEWKLYEERD